MSKYELEGRMCGKHVGLFCNGNMDKALRDFEPNPGDIVELDSMEMKVVGDDSDSCTECRLDVSMDKFMAMLCLCSVCGKEIRDDGLSIHYEEV